MVEEVVFVGGSFRQTNKPVSPFSARALSLFCQLIKDSIDEAGGVGCAEGAC